MDSDFRDPLNVGSSELVSINQLVDLVSDIACVEVTRNHDLTAPQGVRGRNSDNALIQDVMSWEPSISLRDGLEKTYAWIFNEMTA
jgi:GDP-D-mannose 3', 5'-epimerase